MNASLPPTLARAMACMAPPQSSIFKALGADSARWSHTPPVQRTPTTVMFCDWAGVNLAFEVHTEPGYAPDVVVGNVRINGKWVDAEEFLGSDAVITITRSLTQRVCEASAS